MMPYIHRFNYSNDTILLFFLKTGPKLIMNLLQPKLNLSITFTTNKLKVDFSQTLHNISANLKQVFN